MKLTTRTRYGVRLLYQLSLNYDKGYIQLNDIAAAENISIKYLEQIVSFLKSAGLVQSMRGAQGGYIISRHPSAITLEEIVDKLEGGLCVVDCIETGNCDKSGNCSAQNVWNNLTLTMKKVLSSVTLQTMVDESKNINGDLNYNI